MRRRRTLTSRIARLAEGPPGTPSPTAPAPSTKQGWVSGTGAVRRNDRAGARRWSARPTASGSRRVAASESAPGMAYSMRRCPGRSQPRSRLHRGCIRYARRTPCTPLPAPSGGPAGAAEAGREVIRDNPLGLNEGATPEAQLCPDGPGPAGSWSCGKGAEVVGTDRSVVAQSRTSCARADRWG